MTIKTLAYLKNPVDAYLTNKDNYMYALFLNPVTSNAENYLPVARSESKSKLESLLLDELMVEPKTENGYFRSFKKGMLYNYNTPTMHGTNCYGYSEGIVEIINEDDLYKMYQDNLENYTNFFMNAIII